MLRSEKKSFIASLEDIYKTSKSIIVTHYHGLSVLEVTKLRRSLRKNGTSFKVVKNTLSKIAASNVGLLADPEMFSGPTAIAYSKDPVIAAKGVVEFAMANGNLKIISGIINEKILDLSAIQQLARLPSLDALRSIIVATLQAPTTNLARIIQGSAIRVTRIIRTYADKS